MRCTSFSPISRKLGVSDIRYNRPMSAHHDNEGSLKFGLALNSIFTIVEFGFGIFTGSLALIADATHNLTDTFTLTISFLANRLARRKADESKTFGYGRATILAALLNASIMLAVAGFITFEAIQRLQHPVPISGGIVALVALVGIAVNGSIAIVLSRDRQDLNMRSAFIDMSIDALASLATVVSGLIIMATGITYIDSIVGFGIAALLLYNILGILREAVQVLLEGTPKNVDIAAITTAIQKTRKVIAVDDLHIWAIRSNYNALSCHVVMDQQDLMHSHTVVEAIKANLRENFRIQHATIEVELKDCSEHAEHEQH